MSWFKNELRQDGLSQDEKDLIADRLTERDAVFECSRCRRARFTVCDHIALARIGSAEKLAIPCAILICDNCGHLIYHALDTLELKNLVEQNNG
jgi:transcription elongation factor Elf1